MASVSGAEWQGVASTTSRPASKVKSAHVRVPSVSGYITVSPRLSRTDWHASPQAAWRFAPKNLQCPIVQRRSSA